MRSGRFRRFGFGSTRVPFAAALILGMGCGDAEPPVQNGGAGTAPVNAGTNASPTAGTTAEGAGAGGASAGRSSAGAGAAGMAGRAGSDAAAGAGAGGAGSGAAGGAAGDEGGSGMGGAGMGGGRGGMGAGTGGGSGNAGPAGSGAPPVIGDGGTVNATIIVRAGQTYDGQNKRFRAGAALGDGSQSESQQPVFRVEDGGTLKNVVLGSPAADGVHTYGDVTLTNIVWEDIGEDALTIKAEGTVVLNGGSARNGDDKVFQVNAASTFRISNFTATNAGKFLRQNGTTTFEVKVFIDRCDISNMDEAIVRVDPNARQSTVSMTNSRYSNIGGDSTSHSVLFPGVTTQIVFTNNTHY